ncbi:hypothetical protein HETIRDRAFT_118186 [Heterobasidion irregulare TC 32-1]|uniref:Uncharacterized protein n=1 Tax=Heterobasidion irregulare (strain TC 32-1) TaxID=747525 RepID=W4K7P5_HETIT|nr:uncharacterized protein HETIRDRAFT_118186 [Heterobasidion irregulare TC 32-1]ETW81803.1 hypothetical protein HETIRDRAFT_118186 [Heterobasidion irregulare TC 32-1]
MATFFDQTQRSGAYSYETLASATLPMDDAAHLSTHHDENLFGFFSSSLPSQHSSPFSPPSEYGATDTYPDFSGPSSLAATEDDLYAGVHYGTQQVDTPVAAEMGYDSRPAQTWAPAPSRMQGAYWLSEVRGDVAPVAHDPAAFESPVHTGEAYNTLADGPATEVIHDSLTASMDAVANYAPVRTKQKRRAEGDVDKGRIQKRPRHTVDPTPKGKRTPPDPRTGLAPPGETLFQTRDKYKTVDLEDSPRDRQTLASVPPAETRANIQRGPNRPTARATKAAPELEPEVPGEDGRKVRKKVATPGKKTIICAWPVCLETGKMCTKKYGRQHDMLRHVQSKHLRIPRECPNCGTYVLRELSAHQRRGTCVRAGKWSALAREMKAQSFLEQKEVTGVVGGEKLLDREVRSLLEAIRGLIEAGRSQPDDIEDGIDGWMKRHMRHSSARAIATPPITSSYPLLPSPAAELPPRWLRDYLENPSNFEQLTATHARLNAFPTIPARTRLVNMWPRKRHSSRSIRSEEARPSTSARHTCIDTGARGPFLSTVPTAPEKFRRIDVGPRAPRGLERIKTLRTERQNARTRLGSAREGRRDSVLYYPASVLWEGGRRGALSGPPTISQHLLTHARRPSSNTRKRAAIKKKDNPAARPRLAARAETPSPSEPPTRRPPADLPVRPSARPQYRTTSKAGGPLEAAGSKISRRTPIAHQPRSINADPARGTCRLHSAVGCSRLQSLPAVTSGPRSQDSNPPTDVLCSTVLSGATALVQYQHSKTKQGKARQGKAK